MGRNYTILNLFLFFRAAMAGDKTVTFVDVIVTVDHLPMFSRRQ
ncbi:hypothetical protein D3OALGA1CA_1325 [Olavius algarvensis associated proteobacterium Delta 3]|nr:hypothetical protein D3OALGB2SA_605 [Olavius algarvensis associated proteobacterium Delta 3]CAB5099216.1 hypothetical protein D3OALGA1CA_1325 [Olavius algarvensis associated proteobacterium Delta 3]